MPVKFFCNGCGKEIWQEMHKGVKKTNTILEAEERCECSDCILERLQRKDQEIYCNETTKGEDQ